MNVEIDDQFSSEGFGLIAEHNELSWRLIAGFRIGHSNSRNHQDSKVSEQIDNEIVGSQSQASNDQVRAMNRTAQ